MVKNCKECIFAGEGVCNRFRFTINKEQDGCPKGRTDVPEICSCCGQYVDDLTNLVGERLDVALCDNCFAQRHRCVTCGQAVMCSFEQDPSPIPKVVEQRVQQGPMIQIMQIKNPERIKITCENGCMCWNPEFGCMREMGSCGQWYLFIRE